MHLSERIDSALVHKEKERHVEVLVTSRECDSDKYHIRQRDMQVVGCVVGTWGDVWANKLHVPPGEKWYCGFKYVSLLIKGMERSCRGLGRVLQALVLHQC